MGGGADADDLRPEVQGVAAGRVRDPFVRRRMGGALMLGGGAAGLLALAAASPPRGGALVAAVSVLAVLVGLLLAAKPHALPLSATPLLVALGTALITAGTYAGDAVSDQGWDAQMLYLLVVLYSFYFLPPRQAAAELGFVAVAYGVLLAAEVPAENAIARWVLTMTALTGGALIVGSLNRRLEQVIAELATSASRDPLTGVLNRRGLAEEFAIEVSRSDRSGEPLGVVAVDLDGLKAINDAHGHRAGDEALVLAADTMRRELREIDVFARTGGDEFAILLPATSGEAARVVAEKLREALAETGGAGGGPLSASFGAASTPPLEADPERLLNAADEALYRAKAEGRGRTALAT